MRLAKRRLAVLMAALLMIPAQPAMAAQLPPSEIVEMTEDSAIRQTEETAERKELEEMDLVSGEDEDSKEKDPSNDEESENEMLEKDFLMEDELEEEKQKEDFSKQEESEDQKLKEDSKEEEELKEEKENEDSLKKEKSEDSKWNEDFSKEEESEDQKLNEDSSEKEESKVPDLREDFSSEEERNEKVLEKDFSKQEESEDEKLKEDSSKKESESDSKASQKEEISDEEILDEDLIPEEVEEENLQKVKKVFLATPSDAKERLATPKEEICFNTGNHVFHVVSREDFFENELGDTWFEEDGSYTIQIPEQNPFFPYEVQFTYEGKVRNEWFMDPEDSVKVGNHTFYVSAFFDNTVVTQMSLKVGGDIVVIYPEKKKFTDDEMAGIDMLSLLPLKERFIYMDLSEYTPAELTMVSLDQIFMGNEKLDSTDTVVWRSEKEDDYKISQFGDQLDLRYGASNSSIASGEIRDIYWEMFVGDGDQLTRDNIRYEVCISVREAHDWLMSEVYTQNEIGTRTNIMPEEGYDYWDYEPELNIGLSKQLEDNEPIYVGLNINPSVFPDTVFDHLKIYEGRFTSPDQVSAGAEITEQIFNVNMVQKDAGYLITDVDDNLWITIVTFDSKNNVTGCLPLCLSLDIPQDTITIFASQLYDINGHFAIAHIDSSFSNGCRNSIGTLYYGYNADEEYDVAFSYWGEGNAASKITAAYVGQYASISEAVENGAVNIKNDLFDWHVGYRADYSKGVYFTFFIGEDNYQCFFKTVEGSEKKYGYNRSLIDFEGIVDKNGVECGFIRQEEDSYGEDHYLTFLVGENVDLTNLAPIFRENRDAKLYIVGSNNPEISGKSYHDFSKEAIQYTTLTEDGKSSQNYWLRVVHAGIDGGQLYINSLTDEKAETRVENGVIYSIREMFLNGYYQYIHDIVFVNIGKEAISGFSAELTSDEVELDDYWSFKGTNSFLGLDPNGMEDNDWAKGNSWNQAQLRIRAKEGVERGKDISGKLIIKSGETVLMELGLTGVVGDPAITTKEIPQAIKYVPYETIIQNNNKYSWNQVSYEIMDGNLPDGIEMKPNGELYGTPTETGTFTLTVIMENSYRDFLPSIKTFTMTVMDNTDRNIEAATDQGYYLTQRVQNMTVNGFYDQAMVSEGPYEEFENLFLDGVKLEEGLDFISEPGSTRITIRGETLKRANTPGKHTLCMEFRTKNTNTLKRAVQNYEVIDKRKPSGSGGSNSSSGSSHGSSNGKNSSGNSSKTVANDTKKGKMDSQKGIITGEGEGYAHWQLDEIGWKLIYADGTMASGQMAVQPDGSTVEQVLWEKVNGRWYAFGANGYLKSGWVYDYALSGWYYQFVENGMQTGWCKDPQDNCTYYLDDVTGKMITGWKEIDGKWYYFNDVPAEPTWIFNPETGAWDYNAANKNKPYGAMLTNRQTPDGYFVGEDGAWDGREKQH